LIDEHRVSEILLRGRRLGFLSVDRGEYKQQCCNNVNTLHEIPLKMFTQRRKLAKEIAFPLRSLCAFAVKICLGVA
jgi:hypothetical protein